MTTKITPHGSMVEIRHNDEIYYGLLLVDFDRFKTFGNYEIDVEGSMTLFDNEYNRIEYDSPLYDELTDIVEKIVVYEDEDEFEDEI